MDRWVMVNDFLCVVVLWSGKMQLTDLNHVSVSVWWLRKIKIKKM